MKKESNCAECGQAFLKNSNVQKFCTYKCFLSNTRKRPHLIDYRKKYKQRDYVKAAARQYANNRYQPRPERLGACAFCGSEMKLITNKKYCSKTCSRKAFYRSHSDEIKQRNKKFNETTAGRIIRQKAHKRFAERDDYQQIKRLDYVRNTFFKGLQVPSGLINLKIAHITLKEGLKTKKQNKL